MLVHGRITWVGRTSVEVELRVEAEHLLTGANPNQSAYFVYVALDEQRRPVQVPPLHLEDEEEVRRFHEGEAWCRYCLQADGRRER